ncbi:MAG TPA: nucleotide pyrophosphohydrolase [Mycobacteriales bacterium]|nr:nucleotide pyrophosphohydrolase [Mycobacteriales bacterium]
MSDLTELRDRMREFTEDRDWARFHDPKSLILALVGEVGEVAELFQWLPADSARDDVPRGPVEDELADVLLYLIRLADVLEVDLGRAASEKLARNVTRFPADQVRSVAPGRAGCR